MKKKNNIKTRTVSKKESDAFLQQLLKQLVAEAYVKPESVKYISNILARAVKQEKDDTREYNNMFVSKLDTPTLQFMEAGVRNDIFPGEGVLVTGWLQKNIDKNPELAEQILEAMKNEYLRVDLKRDPVMHFSAPISYDIGSKYILRTEQMDTFLSVLKEIEENRAKFISNEDWSVILDAMKKADKRIKNEDVVFLVPLEEGVTGFHRELTNEEKEKFGFPKDSKMDADFRKDDHDLVSLKELANVMRGSNVDYLSPFAGAFLKYLPELNAIGVRGVVFEVENNLLKSIKLSNFDGKLKLPFGPTEAAIAVTQLFPHLKSEDDFNLNTRYYASVSGYVCGPEDSKSYGYGEIAPKLTKVVPAGETILFQRIGDLAFAGKPTISGTRLYFYPVKPSDLHPAYQKMMVVYGQSDNMFHSCAYDPKHEFYNDEYAENFGDNASGNLFNSQAAACYVYNKIIKPESKYTPPASIFITKRKKEFGFLGEEVSNSIYGENEHTGRKYLEFAKILKNYPNEEAVRVQSAELLEYFHSLPTAFLFYKYTQNDKGGLTSMPVATSVVKALPAYDHKAVHGNFGQELAEGALLADAVERANDEKNDYFAIMKDFWAKLENIRKK